MLGEHLTPLLERLFNSYGKSGLQDVIDLYFQGRRQFDIKNPKHRWEAAEEKLAKLAETDPQNRWVKRAIAAIREWMRSVGFQLKLTDTDLIGLMAKSGLYVEGKIDTMNAQSLPVWARADFIPPDRPTWGEFGHDLKLFTVEQLKRMGQAVVPNDGWSDLNRSELESKIRSDFLTIPGIENARLPVEAWDALQPQDGSVKLSKIERQGLFDDTPTETEQEIERRRRQVEDRLRGKEDVPVEEGDGDLFGTTTQRPMFSLKPDRHGGRQSKLASAILDVLRFGGKTAWKGATLPVKAGSFTFRTIGEVVYAPLRAVGLYDGQNRFKLGIAAETLAGDIIVKGKVPGTNYVSNTINSFLEITRHGLIDRYGQPSEYVERERGRAREEDRMMMMLKHILNRLKMEGVGTVEARALQDILEGKELNDERLKKLSEPIRKTIDDMGWEMVQLGLLNEETWMKGLGNYLHRSYEQYESELADMGNFGKKILGRQRKSLIGEELIARGIKQDVTMEHLERVTPPEWWGKSKRKGKADPSLKGTRWIALEKLKEPDPDQQTTQSDEELQMERKSRLIDRVWVPADMGIPKGYEGWHNRGEFEVLGIEKDTITMRRDYNDQEMENMGKVMDARYNLIRTFQIMAHDISSGRFFQDIAKNSDWAVDKPAVGDQWVSGERAGNKRYRGVSSVVGYDWVKVPDREIGKTGQKQWGALSGMYVRPEIWIDLAQLDKAANPEKWRKVLTHWKLNMTARNPVVHMNNVMSNLNLMYLADVRITDLIEALEDYVTNGPDHIAAQEGGAYGQMFVHEDLNRNELTPLIRQLKKEMRKGDDSPQTAAKVMWDMMGGLWEGVRKLDDAAIHLYQVEDAVFRLATFKKYRRDGYSVDEAATAAVDQFLNYDIRAPWIVGLKNSFLPFISYTYRAAPQVAKNVLHRPQKIALMIALSQVWNTLTFELTGDDEEEERGSIPDYADGMTWARIPFTDIGMHRMIKLPLTDKYGQSQYLDITRWMPAGDVMDTSGSYFPPWMMVSGPAVIASEMLLNKSLFLDEEIYDKELLEITPGTEIKKMGAHLWRSYAPGVALIPGTWHNEKIRSAMRGGTDIAGRKYSVPSAVLSGVGVKVRPVDPKTQRLYKLWDLKSKQRAIDGALRDAQKKRDKNLMTEKEYEEATELYRRRARILKKRIEEELGDGE